MKSFYWLLYLWEAINSNSTNVNIIFYQKSTHNLFIATMKKIGWRFWNNLFDSMTKELGLKDGKKISMLPSEKILKFYTCKMLKCMGHQNVLVLMKFYAVELGSSNKPIKTCKVSTIEKLVMVNFLILTCKVSNPFDLSFSGYILGGYTLEPRGRTPSLPHRIPI